MNAEVRLLKEHYREISEWLAAPGWDLCGERTFKFRRALLVVTSAWLFSSLFSVIPSEIQPIGIHEVNATIVRVLFWVLSIYFLVGFLVLLRYDYHKLSRKRSLVESLARDIDAVTRGPNAESYVKRVAEERVNVRSMRVVLEAVVPILVFGVAAMVDMSIALSWIEPGVLRQIGE